MNHESVMKQALRLARRGCGLTSPNPMVGAVLVRRGEIIGRGWHRRAGGPHAEVEAITDARRNGASAKGATLYVTLEPCSTQGRTAPCTDAIIDHGIKSVVVGATDPNPQHSGRGFEVLNRAGIHVKSGVLVEEATRLNEAFNHWIVNRTPFVTMKAAMTLDGKIATRTSESKWITGDKARGEGMKLRKRADAILVGVNTVLADDPSLTVRPGGESRLRRIILDSRARTPLDSRVVSDDAGHQTTIVVGRDAPSRRVNALARRVRVIQAPLKEGRIDLKWLLKQLGKEEVTHLLVEGGGEVNASFLERDLVHRVCFFYAPRILGDIRSRKAVAGRGTRKLDDLVNLEDVKWRRVGPDLMLNARVV